MSKISTVYDAHIARLVALLPNHKRLSDPYGLIKNTDSAKRKGYGLRIGAGENTGTSLSCDIILRREFTIVLTRVVTGRETDSDKKAIAEKTIMEDLFLVLNDFESEPTLGSSAVIDSSFVSDGGVEFIETERDDYLLVLATFSVRYREDLN